MNVAEKIEEFFSGYRLKRYKKRQILIYGGEEPRYVFHLVSGRVRQYDIDFRGNEVVVNVFKPPAFFPMSWAINKAHNFYYFESLTEVQVRCAPAEAVLAFLKNNPEVLYDLMRRLYAGVDGLQRRMAHLMGGTAQSRLLFELIIESERFGKTAIDGSRILSINEIELAQRTGLTRETISRELTKLKMQQLVVRKDHTLVVASNKRLKEALGEDL